MLNEIIPVLSKEIKDNIPLTYIDKDFLILELSCYGSKNNEMYCLYHNLRKEYFLLTFSLMDHYLKSKRKILLAQSSFTLINQAILHQINQNQLAFICDSTIAIIKSLSKYNDNQSDDLYIKSFGGLAKKSIFYFAFSNLDNHYGVLLSDGHFYYNSIEHFPHYNTCVQLFYGIEMKSFNFFPLNNDNNDFVLENFMLLFMEKNGRLYLGGPIFPMEFNIEREVMMSLNEDKDKNGQLEDNIKENIIKSVIGTINDESNSSTCRVKSNHNLLQYNKSMSRREVIVNANQSNDENNSSDYKDNDSITYKQFMILHNYPLTILRITSSNIIEVILINGEIKPQLVLNSFIQVSYNNFYLVERINLNEPLFPLSLIKIISISNTQFIAQLMSNIYLISIPYRDIIKEMANNEALQEMNHFQYKSKVKVLVKQNSSTKASPYGYYFINAIFEDLHLITLINHSLCGTVINISNIQNKDDCNKKTQIDLNIDNDKSLNNNTQQKTISTMLKFKRELNRQFSFGGYDDNDEQCTNAICNGIPINLHQRYKDINREVNESFTLRYEGYLKQKKVIEHLLEKRTIVYDKLLSKIKWYNNTMRSITDLTKEVNKKKDMIESQVKRIDLTLTKTAQATFKEYIVKSSDEMNQMKSKVLKLEQLAKDCLPIMQLRIDSQSHKKLYIPSILGLEYVTKSNIDYKSKVQQEIQALSLDIESCWNKDNDILNRNYTFNTFASNYQAYK